MLVYDTLNEESKVFLGYGSLLEAQDHIGNNEVDWEQLLLLCTGSDIIKAKSEVKSVKQNSSVRTAVSKKLDGSE